MRPNPNRNRIAWGFVDQGFSSATNFGLAILAGRLLGPQGFGTVVVGFTFYLVALGFQRSLVNDPLVAVSAALGEEERRAQARHALTLALAGALLSTGATIVLGAALPGSSARGLLYIAPWLAAALIQDVCRAILFRDHRGRAAAVNDGTWLIAMIVALPVALRYSSAWTVVGVWGIGAVIAALLGVVQIGLVPARLTPSLDWWWKKAAGLGRWLGAGSIVYTLGAHASTFILAWVLGATALGGLRATSTAFGPLSLVIPALALPGLPMITRAHAESRHEASRIAWRLGLTATVVTTAYSAVFLVKPDLLPVIFGASFSGFERLVLPIALAQIVGASTVGFGLLLRAEGRGRALFACLVAYSAATLSLTTAFAIAWGVVGAAWAGVASAAISCVAIAIATFGRRRWVTRVGAPPQLHEWPPAEPDWR